MPNDNRKNQNQNQPKPEQRDGMRDPAQKQEQGGNQQVNRDQDNKDRGKLGEQEGMDRQQQSGRGQQGSPDSSKGELGNEIEDDDEISDENDEVDDENKITQRQPAQQPRGRSDSSK